MRGTASDKQIAEIAPLEVIAFNQLDLPITLPAFQLLLAGDCFFRAFVRLDIDQAVNTVVSDKFRTLAISMLFQPFRHGVGHTYIQGSMAAAREDVDVVHARNTELWIFRLKLLSPVVMGPCVR